MTATPERMDGYNIFELFDYNVPYEIRLNGALEADMLAPFHYYGVADVTYADGTTTTAESDLRVLVNAERVELGATVGAGPFGDGETEGHPEGDLERGPDQGADPAAEDRHRGVAVEDAEDDHEGCGQQRDPGEQRLERAQPHRIEPRPDEGASLPAVAVGQPGRVTEVVQVLPLGLVGVGAGRGRNDGVLDGRAELAPDVRALVLGQLGGDGVDVAVGERGHGHPLVSVSSAVSRAAHSRVSASRTRRPGAVSV